jgi:FtsH-binding integral membrane protein
MITNGNKRDMTSLHSRAFAYATCHFMGCAVLAGVVFAMGFGAALSDVYHPDPWWFTCMERSLIILEAPVAGVAWLSQSAFHSSHMSFPLILCLAIVWSLVLGYSISYARQVRCNREHSH